MTFPYNICKKTLNSPLHQNIWLMLTRITFTKKHPPHYLIRNIFGLDQWGRGWVRSKELAQKTLSELRNNEPISAHDTFTSGLINQYKYLKIQCGG